MGNLMVLLIICLIISASVTGIIRAKKKGSKCVGCPYAKGQGKDCDFQS